MLANDLPLPVGTWERGTLKFLLFALALHPGHLLLNPFWIWACSWYTVVFFIFFPVFCNSYNKGQIESIFTHNTFPMFTQVKKNTCINLYKTRENYINKKKFLPDYEKLKTTNQNVCVVPFMLLLTENSFLHSLYPTFMVCFFFFLVSVWRGLTSRGPLLLITASLQSCRKACVRI